MRSNPREVPCVLFVLVWWVVGFGEIGVSRPCGGGRGRRSEPAAPHGRLQHGYTSFVCIHLCTYLVCASCARLSGWRPSTSLSGRIASSTVCSWMCFGRGSCTRMPAWGGFWVWVWVSWGCRLIGGSMGRQHPPPRLKHWKPPRDGRRGRRDGDKTKDQRTVDVGVVVELLHLGEQLRLGHVLPELRLERGDAHLICGGGAGMGRQYTYESRNRERRTRRPTPPPPNNHQSQPPTPKPTSSQALIFIRT